MSTLKRRHNSNQIIVNTKSSFKSHLVKCQSIMDNTNYNEVVIKAMGKATTRAASLAVRLNANNYNTFQLVSNTYTVEIVEDRSHAGKPLNGADKDGFDPDAIDTSIELVTQVPALTIKVRKNDLEINALAAAKKRGLLKEDYHH